MAFIPPRDPDLCALLGEIQDYTLSRGLTADQMRKIVHAGIGATAAYEPDWVTMRADQLEEVK